MEAEREESRDPGAGLPQRNRFDFSEPREPHIFFNSEFDSGNMLRVVRTAYDHYSLWTATDAQGTDSEGYPKSWFYFEVGGFSNRRVTLSVHRVHFLYAMAKRHAMYRPVHRVKYENGEVSEWSRLPHPVANLALNNDEQLVLKFDFMFSKLVSSVEFAFTYPYGHEECRRDICALDEQFREDKEVFFGQYLLTKTYEGRTLDFVVISSHEGKEGFEATKGLPFSDQKIVRFRANKPIIFVSARVHPIETPSSFTMTGIMRFLLNKTDMRAHLLRKYFVFVLVPMLNPDGVARGHCRMDALNQNLNRYYNNPDPEKQPSCFAVKKLCELYGRDKRLFMYLDLHAHPAFKGNFIFGNAIYEFIEQVESQIYPKVLSQNCVNFDFEQCIFSRKHMKAKDRFEDFSKEGCGRVVFYKEFGLVHSYTLECGYHMNSKDNQLAPEKNSSQQFVVRYKLNDRGERIYEATEKMLDEEKLQKYIQEQESKEDPKSLQYQVFSLTADGVDDKEDDYYKRELVLYGQDTFYNLGRNIMVSVLDVWNKNPFSRMVDMNSDRKEIAERQSKLDRFRKEQAGIKAKQKRIVELIEEQFYAEWHKRNIFNPSLTQSQPQRDKKRNHTLQVQRMGMFRQQKIEKAEKNARVQKEEEKEKEEGRELKTSIASDPLVEVEAPSQMRISSICQTEKTSSTESQVQGLSDNRLYFTKNFKVGRGKQTSSANQCDSKEGCRAPSINKEILASKVKASLEEELIRVQKPEGGLSLSSKVIKNPGFNLNMRVRNVVITGIGNVLSRK